MRYLTRLNFLSSLAFIGILVALSLLYTSGDLSTVGNRLKLYQTPSTITVGADVPALPPNVDHRLVVFGDAWSGTAAHLAEQGRAWPEWFCTMWPCRLETYAQKQRACKSAYCGSVVDETELQTVASAASRSLEPLPDLPSQVDQWLAAELNVNGTDADMEIRTNNTVFALSFLIWDIWKFNGVHAEDTKDSIKRSIGTMFQQLDRLAEHSRSTDLKVLLMMSIDPTFLPAFDPAQGQKDMVTVVGEWNKELQSQANDWTNGSAHVFNTNEFLANQIRSRQFYMAGMIDGYGLGKKNVWDDVENPCVQTKGSWMPWLSDKPERCESPEKFLFWDGLHLGPTANKIMSKAIFHDMDALWIKKPTNST